MKTRLSFVMMLACGLSLNAQNVISTRSGLIHFVDGYGATLDGLLVSPKLGEFPLMRDGETLASENARVEVLLNPGVFLRLDEHSSFKMVRNKLSDTRVEMLTGSAIVELDEPPLGNSLMLLFHDAKITPTKHGLYRLDADQRRFRVSEGEAQVIQGDQTVELKGGRQVEFGAVLAVSKFNRKIADSLDTWAAGRSQQIAQANITSAKMVSTGGSSSYTNSVWIWNPYYGLFTYLPARGYGYNPYGWRYYSPRTVDSYYHPSYQQPSVYAASNGAGDTRGSIMNNSVSNGSAVSSNPAVAAAPAPVASAPPASMSRGSISGGGGQGR
jgi:hypothetical protein